MNEKYTQWKGNGEVLDVFAKNSIKREREYGRIMEQSIPIQWIMDIHDQIPTVKVVEKVDIIGRIQCFSFDPFHLY